MQRELRLKNYEIILKACNVENMDSKNEIYVSNITAVNIKNSKALEIASGYFGIVVYNELYYYGV